MSPSPDGAGRWSEARQEVEDLLLGGGRTLRRGDVAARADVSLEQSARLWSALDTDQCSRASGTSTR